MYVFSKRSKKNLLTCDEKLQMLINEVIKETDCSVICGYRGEEAQEKAFNEGRSRARFGQSKHNDMPSSAVDVVPSPLDWDDLDAFNHLGEMIMSKAKELDIKIKWGKHFKGLVDYPHFELVKDDA